MEMSAATVDILTPGHIVREGRFIKEAHSSSSLVRSRGESIVVDTSSRERREAILYSLGELGVDPADVGIVVSTHCHGDHTANDDLFENAEFIIHEGEGVRGDKTVMTGDLMEIAAEVVIVHTPGHSRGSISVFIESDRRYAIVGDAIPTEDNFRRMLPPGIHYDAETALQSIKRIGEFADIIVPGHDFPFSVKR